jgi:hypothetical protein
MRNHITVYSVIIVPINIPLYIVPEKCLNSSSQSLFQLPHYYVSWVSLALPGRFISPGLFGGSWHGEWLVISSVWKGEMVCFWKTVMNRSG